MKKRMLSAIISFSIIAQMLAAFSTNVLAATNVNEVVDTWGVQKRVDDTTLTGWQTSKGKDGYCCLALNGDHDFVYIAKKESADHFLYLSSKEVGYKGDWAVEFDMFLNDIDCADCVTDAKTTKRNIRLGVGYDDADGNLVKNYYDNFYSDLTSKTLSDDEGKAHYIYEATARKKFGLDASTGTDFINVRLAIIDDVLYICRKWNNEEKWVVNQKALNVAGIRNYMYIQCGTHIGIDNFTVYRPKDSIVKEPEDYTYYDLADDDAENMIVNPHFGTPVFTEPKGTFTAEFTCNDENVDFTKGSFDVYLENEYKSWYAVSTTPVKENIYLGTKTGYKTQVTVPENISPELLNLYMVHKNSDGVADAEFYAPKSVSVTEELDQDFYSVAISDTHINKWGGPEYAAKNARVLQFFNKAISVGGARYLSHSGDINDNVTMDRKGSMVETFVRAFEESDVPLIVVAGNHEYDTYTYPSATETLNGERTQVTYAEYIENADGAYTADNVQIYNTFTESEFDKMFGTKTALITMGDDMVIAKHDFGAWKKLTGEGSVFINLRDALADAWDNSSADYRIIYQHTEDTGKENLAKETYGMAAFMSPSYHSNYLAGNPEPYDIQYTGHYHKTYVRTDDVLTLGGNGKGEASWKGDGIISNFTYNANGDEKWGNSSEALIEQYADLDESGIGVFDEATVDDIQTDFIDNFNLMTEAIEERFYKPNDGTSTYNIATVKNMIDFNFYDGRVKFIMPPGKYRVKGGEVLSQYDSYDGLKTIVVAKVNIPKGSVEAPAYVNVVCQPETEDSTLATEIVLKGAETGFVGADVKYLDLVSNTDIKKDTFAIENISITSDGIDIPFEITYPDVKTARLVFADKLVSNCKYTVTLSDSVMTTGDMSDTIKNFEFIVLPDEGIEFFKKTITKKGSSGYRTANDKNMTVNVNGVSKGIKDLTYKDYVIDYTLALPGYTNDGGVYEPYAVGETTARLDWFITTTDGNGAEKVVRLRSMTPSLNPAERPKAYSDLIGKWFKAPESVLVNPLYAKTENAYNFRIVKIGNRWTLYAKNVSDDSYDIILDISGENNHIYNTSGYTDLYVSVPGSLSYWYDYILYPIENSVTADENVGEKFDITFDVQPNNLSSLNVDGVGEVVFEAITPKTYRATMPAGWSKASEEAVIDLTSVTDVYGNGLSQISISPEEYEVDFIETKLLQNGKYTDSVLKGEFVARVVAKENWTLPENTKLICAIYDSEKRLVNAQISGAENISYNGTSIDFTMSTDVDNPTIRVFAINMSDARPLARMTEK